MSNSTITDVARAVTEMNLPYVQVQPFAPWLPGSVRIVVTDVGRRTPTGCAAETGTTTEQRGRDLRMILAAMYRRPDSAMPALVDDLQTWYFGGSMIEDGIWRAPRASFSWKRTPIDLGAFSRWSSAAGRPVTTGVQTFMCGAPHVLPEWWSYYDKWYGRVCWAYANAALDWFDFAGEHGRVWHVADGALTGRSSTPSSGAPFINGHGVTREQRRMIQARPGRIWIECDYSAAEVCTLAAVSGDLELAVALRGDLYSDLAKSAFGDAASATDMRDRVKACIIQFLYGAGPASIAKIAVMSGKEVGRVVTVFLERFRRAAEWIIMIRESAKSGSVTTPVGRVMAMPAPYMAVNYTLQSITSEWCRCAFVLAQEMFDDLTRLAARAVVHIHDGYWFQVPREETSRAEAVIRFALGQRTRAIAAEVGAPTLAPFARVYVRTNMLGEVV